MPSWSEDAARNRELWTKSNAEYTDAHALASWNRDPKWGMRRLGEEMAERGDPGRPEAMIVLASTSPQRAAILTQLGIAFEAVAPAFEEKPGGDPVEHAAGKARSVDGGGRPVLGVDTIVICRGEQLGKPSSAADARRMLRELSGWTHEVVSGFCLRTPDWEEAHSETTLVTFRPLTERDIEHYLASGEWESRAGAYAIQGLGASLVERIEGDYLNVVGLPGALLIRLLAEHFPGTSGFG